MMHIHRLRTAAIATAIAALTAAAGAHSALPDNALAPGAGPAASSAPWRQSVALAASLQTPPALNSGQLHAAPHSDSKTKPRSAVKDTASKDTRSDLQKSAEDEADRSALLDAQLFYAIFLGELSANSGDPSSAYSLMLEAARRSNDPGLYQRATDIALSARAGEQALAAARAWQVAQPGSREANRYVLQILIALNRIAATAEPLKKELAAADTREKMSLLLSIPDLYGRNSDKTLAANVVESALSAELENPATGPTAWVVIGRMRLAEGKKAEALQAARQAHKLDPTNDDAIILALELLSQGTPGAQELVKPYFDGQPKPQLRLAYARMLINANALPAAAQQVQAVTDQNPDLAEGWLLKAALQFDGQQLPQAQASLDRYMALVNAASSSEAPGRKPSAAPAYLLYSQIAEKRKDFAGAQAWLDKIDPAHTNPSVQLRQASLLAQQGKIKEARTLIRQLPTNEQITARMKLAAEVQLLRDSGQFKDAYELQAKAVEQSPNEPELAYDLALLAEKMGKIDTMEELLRNTINKHPDYYPAYNALGYSYADQGVRLDEAEKLIQKALSHAPQDPFIMDSLAWVKFRQGNAPEALRILQTAYQLKADAEIAAHWGEVLWSVGQREQARAIWKQGLQINATNSTLLETLKRLGVAL